MPIWASMPAAIELSTGLTDEACTRTSTSLSAGRGTGRSSRRAGGVSGPSRVTARVVVWSVVLMGVVGPLGGSGRFTVVVSRRKYYSAINDWCWYIVSMAASKSAPPAPSSILDEHRSSPGLLLALLGHEAMRRLRAAHTAHGLKPRQFQILGLLYDHGGLAQRELMETMGIDPSILVTLLNPLEAEGLVTRDRDLDDRRRHLVALTLAGEKKLVAASRAQKDTEDELFASLAGDQRSELRALLVELRDALGTEPERVGAREAKR